jgi:hypothetical protein
MIGRLLEPKRPRPRYGWTFTSTLLKMSGLETGDAVAMARGVVWVLVGGEYPRGE